MENKESEIYNDMSLLLAKLQKSRPEERSEIARRYAVTITEFEKVLGYFYTFIVIPGLERFVDDNQ